VVPRERRLECALLKGVAAYYVMLRDSHEKAQVRQREVITDLVGALAAGAPDTLGPVFRDLYEEAPDDAGRLRAVIDEVASLTDTAALFRHRGLGGEHPGPRRR
jgi:dGTPase